MLATAPANVTAIKELLIMVSSAERCVRTRVNASCASYSHLGIKLGKALYYRHMEELFEGDIYVRLLDPLLKLKDADLFQELIEMAPAVLLPCET
jgi:hypothetical protein